MIALAAGCVGAGPGSPPPPPPTTTSWVAPDEWRDDWVGALTVAAEPASGGAVGRAEARFAAPSPARGLPGAWLDPLSGPDDCGLFALVEVPGSGEDEPEGLGAGLVTVAFPDAVTWSLDESFGTYHLDFVDPLPGTYAFGASGGDVPGFDALPVQLPEPLALDEPVAVDLPLRWDGGGEGTVHLEVHTVARDGAVWLVCDLVDDGEHAIDPSVAERLPDGVARWTLARRWSAEHVLDDGSVVGALGSWTWTAVGP